jgi:hypothetical protein
VLGEIEKRREALSTGHSAPPTNTRSPTNLTMRDQASRGISARVGRELISVNFGTTACCTSKPIPTPEPSSVIWLILIYRTRLATCAS